MAKHRNVRKAQLSDQADFTKYPNHNRGDKHTQNSNVLSFDSYAHQRKNVSLIPKSLNQETYIDLLLDQDKTVVFATGPAGTGKTMLAVMAAIKALKEGQIDRIVVTRPAVGVDDEKHGFLPGTLNEKMAPWTRPIFDVFKEYYSSKQIAAMLEEEIIEISPLAYLRGRTFKKCWIIADEMQNTSVNQLFMLLTRIGDNSRMVLTGDLNQSDKQFRTDSGLKDFFARFNSYGGNAIARVEMTNKDVHRHPVVGEILHLYS